MRHQPLTPLLAVAHGSRDPRAAATIEELLDRVRHRSGLPAVASYLDHAAPTPAQALGALSDRHDEVVVLPLLLTAAYHSKVDIPRSLRAPDGQTQSQNHNLLRLRPRLNGAGDSGPHGPGPHGSGQYAAALRFGGTLGPHPLLTEALERRLAEAGCEVGDPDTAVVIVAAGSSDPGANGTIGALAREWRRRGWFGAVAAFASAARPTPAEAVRALLAEGAPRVVVASYFLAPGYFADKVRAEALGAGATAVSEVLGTAPEVAKLITLRYVEALESSTRAAAG